MPLNEYDSPLIAQQRQTYVSQFVPLPFKELQMALDRKQRDFDVAEATRGAIEDQFLKVKALQKDEALRNRLVDGYNQSLDDMLRQAGGDYGVLGSKIRMLGRDVKRDLSQGQLGAIAGNYAQYQQYIQGLSDQHTKGDITKQQLDGLAAISYNNYQGVQEALSPNEQYNRFSGISAAKFQDIDKKVEELAKGYAADQVKNKHWFQTPDGKYWRMTANGRKQVTYDEIYQGVMPAISRDQQLMDYMVQKHQINAYQAGPEYDLNKSLNQDIQSAVHRGAAKYSFLETEHGEDIKADKYALQAEKYLMENPLLSIETPTEAMTVTNPAGKTLESTKAFIKEKYDAAHGTLKQLLLDNINGAKNGGSPAELQEAMALYQKFAGDGKTKGDPEAVYNDLLAGNIKLPHVQDYSTGLNNIQQLMNDAYKQEQRIQLAEAAADQAIGKDFKKWQADLHKKALENIPKNRLEIGGVKFTPQEYYDLFKTTAPPGRSHVRDFKSKAVKKNGHTYTVKRTDYDVSTNPYTGDSAEFTVYEDGKPLKVLNVGGQIADEGVGFPLAEYNQYDFDNGLSTRSDWRKAKAKFLEETGEYQVSSMYTTAMPGYALNEATGRYEFSTKNAVDNTKKINTFFKNYANLTGMQGYAILGGDGNQGTKDDILSLLRKKFDINDDEPLDKQLQMGDVRLSHSGALNGNSFFGLMFTSKDGQKMEVKVPINAQNIRSNEIMRMLNNGSQRASSLWESGKAEFGTKGGFYRPFTYRSDIAFDYKNNRVIVGNQSLDMQEGIMQVGQMLEAIDNGNVNFPLYSRDYVQQTNNPKKQADFTDWVQLKDTWDHNPNAFDPNKEYTYHNKATGEIKSVKGQYLYDMYGGG